MSRSRTQTGRAGCLLGALARGIEERQLLRPRRPPRLRRWSTVNSIWSFVPGRPASAATVASAIIFLSVGDQVVLVALPTCMPSRKTGTETREAVSGSCGARPDLVVEPLDVRPARPRGRRAGAAGTVASLRAAAPPGRCRAPSARLTSRPRPISNGEYCCDAMSAFVGAHVVDVEQDQAGLDARHVERQHAGRRDVVRPARVHQRVPDRARRLSHGIQIS